MNNNIKKYREEQDMKQETLAELSKLSCGYICHLEKGTRENPSYRAMTSIAKALNKTVTEVFEEN